MHLGEPASKKTKFRITVLAIVLVLAFIGFFFREILDVIKLFFGFALVILGFDLPNDPGIYKSFNVVLFNCVVGFIIPFLIWLLLISHQALLPVQGVRDIYRTAYHLFLYILRQHGPAYHIKDGKAIASKEELDRKGPGVIVVDFNSAVVLEEREPSPGLSRIFKKIALSLLHILDLADPLQPTRVCGPGIVFTHPGERLRGSVDLRKQFRMQKKVHTYTREGIELYANVLSIFTIGQDPEPDALQVTYIGEQRPENLRVVSFSRVTESGVNYLRVTDISDELDTEDAKEIHHFARVAGHTNGAYRPYIPLPQHPPVPVFNQERVFSAVFAQARGTNEDVITWTDLPTQVAAGFFREILPTINYDQLYDVNNTGKFPLYGFKRKLMLAMRNNGLLAFRLVQHRNGAQLTKDKLYPTDDLLVSQTRRLTNPKLLRDRGIKVMLGSFGDLFPTSPIVYKQRLDSWRSRWEKELDITTASRELHAMRIHGRAMVEAQRDLWFSLNQLFSLNENNHEALALYIMQALESAAADPKTRQLLPNNTLDFMKYIQSLLNSVPAAIPPQPGQAGPGGGQFIPPVIGGPN